MDDLLILLCLLMFVAFIVAVPVFLYDTFIGTRTQRQRRHQAVLHAFDGSEEVRVRVTGTGLSVENVVWLARCHGYDIWEWETSPAGTAYLRMRRIDRRGKASPSPVDQQGWHGSHPHPGHAHFPQPSLKDLQAIRKDVYRTGSRNGALWGILTFAGIGIISALNAFREYQAGHSYVTEAVIFAISAITATAGVFVSRNAARRRNNRFKKNYLNKDGGQK
ncbi:hypothetical protein [Streptomyces tubercidicus]